MTDFEQVLAEYHRALERFVNGDPEPVAKLFSRREDVTLANPFGSVARGWTQVRETMNRAVRLYRDGHATDFELHARHEAPGFVFLLETESYLTKVGGKESAEVVRLRVTSLFGREGSAWTLLSRHADPLVDRIAPGDATAR